MKVKLSPEINLTSNFKSSLKYNGKSQDLKNYSQILKLQKIFLF